MASMAEKRNQQKWHPIKYREEDFSIVGSQVCAVAGRQLRRRRRLLVLLNGKPLRRLRRRRRRRSSGSTLARLRNRHSGDSRRRRASGFRRSAAASAQRDPDLLRRLEGRASEEVVDLDVVDAGLAVEVPVHV